MVKHWPLFIMVGITVGALFDVNGFICFMVGYVLVKEGVL